MYIKGTIKSPLDMMQLKSTFQIKTVNNISKAFKPIYE